MKWFMAFNEPSINEDAFFNQVIVAVLSAQKHTNLSANIVYDGDINNKRIAELESMGVKVYQQSIRYKKELTKYINSEGLYDLLKVRQGAFLRYEIPNLLMQEKGLNEELVLYTDCDVIFQNNPNLNHKKIKYIAAHGKKQGGRTRFRLGGYWHFNSGVLLINIQNFHLLYNSFINFILNNGGDVKRPNEKFMQKNLFLSDQVALNLFLKNKINKLDKIYNWHPSSGVNDAAVIIHFNGLKWTQWEAFNNNELRPDRMKKFQDIVNKNREGYEHYVNLANEYLKKYQTA